MPKKLNGSNTSTLDLDLTTPTARVLLLIADQVAARIRVGGSPPNELNVNRAAATPDSRGEPDQPKKQRR